LRPQRPLRSSSAEMASNLLWFPGDHDAASLRDSRLMKLIVQPDAGVAPIVNAINDT